MKFPLPLFAAIILTTTFNCSKDQPIITSTESIAPILDTLPEIEPIPYTIGIDSIIGTYNGIIHKIDEGIALDTTYIQSYTVSKHGVDSLKFNPELPNCYDGIPCQYLKNNASHKYSFYNSVTHASYSLTLEFQPDSKKLIFQNSNLVEFDYFDIYYTFEGEL